MRKRVVCRLVGPVSTAQHMQHAVDILEYLGWTKVFQSSSYVEMVGDHPTDAVLRLTFSGYFEWYVSGKRVSSVYYVSGSAATVVVGNRKGFLIHRSTVGFALVCGYLFGLDGVKRFWVGELDVSRPYPKNLYHIWDDTFVKPIEVLAGEYPVPRVVTVAPVDLGAVYCEGQVVFAKAVGLRCGDDKLSYVLPDYYYIPDEFRPGGIYGFVNLRSDLEVSTGFLVNRLVVDLGGLP